MNWKLKWALSYALNSLPSSGRLYDIAQKRFTKNWERDIPTTMSSPNSYTMHLDVFQEHPRFVRRPPREVAPCFRQQLLDAYGIDYRAPQDARKVDLPDGTIDLIATTSTFEHIPHEVLSEILIECYRLCHSGSLMSVEIDYTDHYWHSDKKITPYNFLQFSSAEWARLHMKHNYTNCLRHSDYRTLIAGAGFKVIDEKTITPDHAERSLSSIRLAHEYAGYERSDLMITCGRFVAVK